LKVYNSLDAFLKLNNAIVTTGTYDGVHKGHRKILQTLVETAKADGGESVVISFWPHPKKILSNLVEQEGKSLTTIEEKTQLLKDIGIHHFLILPFNREFSELTSEEYVQQILVNKIGTKKLIIGYDHRFGKNREGSFEYLLQNSTKFGFTVVEIPKQDLNDIAISSTEVRNALLNGNVVKATMYLEQPYTLKGLVVKGKQLGHTIGFPTANIKVYDSEKLIPANGVYATKVVYKGQQLKGMLNIGYRPTLDGVDKTIEVNIFDFNKEIYGEELEIIFVERIRSEEKFSGLDALKLQLAKDKTRSIELLT